MKLLKHYSSAQQASYFIVSAFLKPHVHVLHQRLLFQPNYRGLNPSYPSKLQRNAQPAFFKRYLIWQKHNTHRNQETFCLIPPAPPCQALSHTYVCVHIHALWLSLSLSYRHTCTLSLCLTHTVSLALSHTCCLTQTPSICCSLPVSFSLLFSLQWFWGDLFC